MATLRQTPTPELMEMKATLEMHLTWGLSKQARKSTEIKLRAINIALQEKEEPHADIA